MATFVLLPGAGGSAWYWHRVRPLLEQAGHEVVSVDLPGPDPEAGLEAYADQVVAAVSERREVVLVAQSMGAFTAALVAGRLGPQLHSIVLANAMIPLPGETPGDWWDNTGWEEARLAAAQRGGYSTEMGLEDYFFHDLPPEVVEGMAANDHDEAAIAFEDPARYDAWPDVPLHVVTGRDDRLFPAEFQARLAKERLGKPVDLVPGGHLNALAYPRELAAQLLAYVS